MHQGISSLIVVGVLPFAFPFGGCADSSSSGTASASSSGNSVADSGGDSTSGSSSGASGSSSGTGPMDGTMPPPTDGGFAEADASSGSHPEGGFADAGAPSQAAAAGYTVNTFHTPSFTTTNVDLQDTAASGFQWYLKQPVGWPDTLASQVVLNADGSVTLTGSIDAFEAAWPTPAPWHGVGFGGGAYFEATLSFNPNDVLTLKPSSGWPAFWATPLEHVVPALGGDQWPGMPSGYEHFIETDFFEYNVYRLPGAPNNDYLGATIDWAGAWTGSNYPYMIQNAPGGGSNFTGFLITTPSTTDYTQPHKFGYLWVPATATTQGSAQYYFDGQATNDHVTWSMYDCKSPPAGPPGTTPWTFGILDCQHPSLVLDSAMGMPMRVYSVDVWQASSASNISM